MPTTLRGRPVRVESARGQRFDGYLVAIHPPTRHVLLQDATAQPGGATYPQAFVAEVDWIVPTTGEGEVIEVDPETVTLPPYAVDAFEPANHANAIRTVNREDTVFRFPVVSRSDDELSLAEGHFSLWLARQAHLEYIPVVVESFSDWRQAVRFAFDHFPLPHDIDDSPGQQRGRYPEAAMERSLEQYLEIFEDDATEIYPVRANAERLGITTSL